MSFIQENLPFLLAGISVGGQYALIAIGYTMVYGILRLINFAHGDVFMVAGLVMVYASTALPLYISIPLVIILTVILGVAIEKVAYKPLRYRTQNVPDDLRYRRQLSAPELWRCTSPAVWHKSLSPRSLACLPNRLHRRRFHQGGSRIITPFLTIFAGGRPHAAHQPHQDRHGHACCLHVTSRLASSWASSINNVISMTFIIGTFLAAVGSLLYFTNYQPVVPILRRHARPEGLRGCGLWRHRLHPRCGDRRVHHRHLRKYHQGSGSYLGVAGLGLTAFSDAVHLRPADRRPLWSSPPACSVRRPPIRCKVRNWK